VVPKGPNVDVIENEIQGHPKGEQKDKPAHLVRHAWYGFAENEGYPNRNCAPSDNSDNSKDEWHSLLGKE
jgi:hypothetical protein